MMLLDQLNEDMKTAMKAREALRTQVLRMILSDCKYARVEKMRDLEDTDVLAVIRKGIKSREDSESQYRAAGRADLADKEAAESAILRAYLPAGLSAAELEAAVNQAIQETGATSMKDMGKVMKAALAALSVAGKPADGKRVNEAVRKRLGG
jgi:uncharacterized protein YqeY